MTLSKQLSARYTSLPQKRALAQLLSLLRPEVQPASLIAALIGEADNAKVVSLTIESGGVGYSSTPPVVTIAPPPTAAGRSARARAVMARTGRWRGVRVSLEQMAHALMNFHYVTDEFPISANCVALDICS